MGLDFHRVVFDRIGAQTPNQNVMWGSLSLTFSDEETQVNPVIELTLPLVRNHDTTMAALQTQARERAVALLKQAIATLEEHDIPHLETMSLS